MIPALRQVLRPQIAPTARSRVQALEVPHVTSQLLFSEDWDDLDDWSVTDSNGDISVADNILTVSNTSGGVNLIHEDTDWANETEPYAIEFDWDYTGTGIMRCLLRTTGAAQAYISQTGTALTTAGSDLVASTVTPSAYDHDERNRIIIVVDPVALRVHFYILHLTTAAAQQYEFLGTEPIAAAPTQISFLTGSAASEFAVHPIRVWRVWGATIGDSLATGSPDYSPVPRAEATPDVESQIAHWIEQDQSSARRVLNFGKGGSGFAHVQGLDAALVTAGVKVVFVWVGTNNIGSETLDLAGLKTAALDVMSVLDAGGVLAVMINIVPRPNFSSPGPMNALRHEYNTWLKGAVRSTNAIYVDAASVVAEPADYNDLQAAYNADDVHLTVAGYTAVANEIMRVLRRYS